MSDIYATPEADLSQNIELDRAGGNIDDAVAGNFQVNMLETLGEAWRGLKGFKLKCHIALLLYFLVFLGIAIVVGLVIAAIAVSGGDESVSSLVSFVLQIAMNFVLLPIGVSIFVMAMRHANRKPVSAGEVFRHFDVMVSLFVTYVLQTLLMLIGFVLFVLPGIYLMFAYGFALPLVLEKKMGPWHALETSRRALTRVWFRYFGLIWLIMLINTLGILTLGIAWIWTVPWSILTLAMVYQKIFGVEAHTLAE